MRSPSLQAVHDRILHACVLIEAQKTIGTKVDDVPPGDVHFTMRAKVIDDEILEMCIGVFACIVFDEANQSVLTDRLREILHWRE